MLNRNFLRTRAGWQALLGGVSAVLVLGACAAATSTPPTSPSPASSAPLPSEQPTTANSPTELTLPDRSVQVDWSQGRKVTGMSIGVPNPPGWYSYAFGPQDPGKVLYLTYDDGPTRPWTGRLLDLLNEAGAKATFFVTGHQAKLYPELVDRITAEGHALGNHTRSHEALTDVPAKRVRWQLEQTELVVGSQRIGNCMRPPYGLINSTSAQVADRLGYTPVLWTGHAEDWNAPSAAQIVARLKAATQPGAVLLLHDGPGKRQPLLEATRQLLPWWQQQGYRFETVPACR